jgi:hypothetical protein
MTIAACSVPFSLYHDILYAAKTKWSTVVSCDWSRHSNIELTVLLQITDLFLPTLSVWPDSFIRYVILIMNMGTTPANHIHTPLLHYVEKQLRLNRTVLLTGSKVALQWPPQLHC